MDKVEEKPLKVMTEDELWARVFKGCVAWLMKKRRLNCADAEEIAQEAIAQFIRSGGVVDTSDPKTLLKSIGSRANGILVNMRRKKAQNAVNLTSDGKMGGVHAPARLDERIDARKAISTLLDRVSDDPLASDIVMSKADGVEDPRDIARVLGRDIRDVYNAFRRLKTHVENVEKIMEVF